MSDHVASATPSQESATLAQRLAGFVNDVDYSALPQRVADSVRSRVLDTLGICIAAGPLPTSAAARSWARAQAGVPQAHAIGVPVMLPGPLAAFVNGTLAHSLDYDDTHLPSVLHPSASVIPATLAAAESAGATGPQAVAAAAAGLEVCVRLGMAGYDPASRNSTFFEHGQHATSICGALGSAAAAAKLLRLDARGITDALAIAASMASGVIEANRTGGTVKRLHCGWAAHAGLSAAGLAQAGFTGPATVLEGRFGFFQAWLHGVYNPGAITSGLGDEWVVPDIFFKPYPANHFTHAAVDAAAQLRAGGLRPEQVAHATLGVAASTVRTIGEPIDVKRAPETGYMAKFSGPFAVTVGLFGGTGLGAGQADYTDELARDPARRALMRRIDVVADPLCDRIFPHQFPATLSVHTTGGDDLHVQVLTNRGGPDRPLSFDELATKFTDNATPALSREAADTVRTRIEDLGAAPSLAAIMSPLAELTTPDDQR